MKIRIKGNSIRFRLSKTEVDTLAANGSLEDKTEFNDGVFGYAVQSKKDITHPDAAYLHNIMTMYVPEGFVSEWPSNQIVGISHTLTLNNGGTLSLLIEKDFKCIDADVSEDQSDNFDNPSISC